MESSGKYWIPIFNALEKTCNVCLTHPKYVKAIKGKKTDKKDAKWIAELFKCDLVRSSFIPPADIRQLRDLCRYYVKLTGFASGEKNRAQNCLTMCNFKLDDVFSDVFGKSATRVLDALLEHGNGNFELDSLISGKCKASPEEIRADMSVFETAKQLTSWAGLTPQNQESAGKKKTTRIGRAGAYLKPLTAIWHILSKNEAYNAELYRQADKPPATRELTTEQALAFLRNKGFLIVDEDTGEIA